MPQFTLKTYQKLALEELELFLRQASTMGLEASWAHSMGRQSLPQLPYRTDELGAVPCVCLRIPTRGGKTLMASHAIPRIARAWANTPFPVALWLTPSDMIRTQTIDALQVADHPYAAALREACGDAYRVIEIGDLATIAPQDFGRLAIVVVATIQTFRVEKRSDRRVYSFSEAFEPHFCALGALGAGMTPARARELGLAVVEQADLDEEKQSFLAANDIGRVKSSAANLLALMRPIVIVDEAHNAKTPKSLDMLRAICPSAVLDLTATPVPKKTNVLYSVSARELEAEQMIKLPILLAEHTPDHWGDAVRDAVLRRHALEAEAANELDYLRPIVLFQAQDVGGDVPPDRLKAHLINVEKIPEYEIAIATGTQRDLDGINLLDPTCQIRYVITVQALREGWDCPFAYVLCSLQNLRSNTAVEELLGRVLRMPYATRRKSRALNRAYVQVIAKSFTDAAGALVDKMVEGMGFNPIDAATVLMPDAEDWFAEGGGGEAPSAPREPVLKIELSAAATEALAAHPDIVVTASDDAGRVTVSVLGEVTDAIKAVLMAAVGKDEAPKLAASVQVHNLGIAARKAPSERGITFKPLSLLCLKHQGELQLLDRRLLEDIAEFDLLLADPQPKLEGFNLVQQSEQIEIYLQGERVTYGLSNEPQMSLNAVPTAATENDLVRMLAQQARSIYVGANAMNAYVSRLVAHLIRERGYSLTGLVRAQFQLSQAIIQRIETVQAKASAAGFQQLLFGNEKFEVAASPDWTFEFRAGAYPARNPYAGGWRFDKHFFSSIADLKVKGEEFECAKAIDVHPAVRHWVRNLSQDTQFAFWLPTATDRFYPDFVVELMDGRVAVVEYKGESYASNDDSREKRLVGERWAHTTGHLFAWWNRSGMG